MNRRRIAKRKDFPDNLYCKTDGYFWYRNPKTGKTKGLGRDRAHAFREARAANHALESLPPLSLADWVTGKKSYTLVDWVKEYGPMWEERTSPAKSTKENAKMYMRQISEAEFAKRDITTIESQHVAAYLDAELKARGPATVKGLRSRLMDVFRQACAKGLIDKNPVSVTYRPTSEVKRDRLSLEQFNAIHEKAPPWAQNAMWLALVTGQRREDVATMKFSDVRNGYLHVEQSKSGGKTKLRLDVKIKIAGRSIEDVVRQCRDSVVSQYLIHHTKSERKYKAGDKIATPTLSAGFAAARDAAKIKPAKGKTPPTFHEIRSLSERLYKEAYGAEFAQNMLGHKNAQMTAKYDDPRGGYREIKAK